MNASRTRRQLFGSAAALVAATVASSRLVAAIGGATAAIDGPARAGVDTGPEPAVRLRLDRQITFPVLLPGDLILFDNFGGASVAYGPGGHRGVDIWRRDGQPGQPLVACVDGVLVEQEILEGNQGNSWVLQGAGDDFYRYHHLDEFADGLQVGDLVERGQVIGTMGSTGNPDESAPHLHFEVRQGRAIGQAVDPRPLLPLPLPGVQVI